MNTKVFEEDLHLGHKHALWEADDFHSNCIKSRHIADHAILSRHLSDKCIDDLRKFLSLEDLASALTGMSDYYTKEEIDALLQDIDVDIDLSGFYTKHEVDLLLRTLKQGRFEAVAELPEASVLTLFTIYLVPSTNSQQANVKDEFITVQDQEGNYRWEQIGSTTIDLSGYLKTKDFFSTLDNIPAETTYKKDDNGEDTDVVDKYGWDAIEKLLSWLDKKYQAKGTYLTEHQSLEGKQNVIEDLEDIRSGAEAGSRAYQKPGGGIPESDLAQALQNKIDSMPSDATVGQKANKVTWAEGQSKQDELAILASDGDIKASGKKLSHLLLLAELAAKINSEIPAETVYKKDDQGNPTNEIETLGWDKITKLKQYLDKLYLAKNTTIPAAQVQSDWNASEGMGVILNKPTIPDAQIQSDWNQSDDSKKDFIKNKPTIPAAQVQADWNVTDSNSKAYIKNKPDAATKVPTTDAQGNPLKDENNQNIVFDGQLVELDANGNIKRSSKKVTDVVEQVQADWDETSTSKKSFIKNKPTIPAAQVQSDWNESDNSKKSFIQNKPTIPAAQVQSDWDATDGMGVILNKPTIPAAQVQSDWNETDSSKKSYIKNKPTIPEKMATQSVSSPSSLNAQANTCYSLGEVNTLEVTLPTITSGKVETIILFFDTGTNPSINFLPTEKVRLGVGVAFEAENSYEVSCLWNGEKWVVCKMEI